MTEELVDSFDKKEDAIDTAEEEFGVLLVRDCFSDVGNILLTFRNTDGFRVLSNEEIYEAVGIPEEKINYYLAILRKRSLVEQGEDGAFSLTEPGEVNARILYSYKKLTME